MRILILSNTPWNRNNSFGNSFANIFEGIPDVEIANIYCRYGEPEQYIASRFFQITEKDLIKNLKNSNHPSGKEIFPDKKQSTELNSKEADSVNNIIRKKRWRIFYWARDFIWKIGRWESDELKTFIDDFNPDLIFQPVYYSSYLTEMALFIKNYTNVPMLCYISDDNYTLRQFNLSPFYWMERFYKRRKVKKVIDKCEVLYVISEVQKADYEKVFNPPCKVLTKLSDFSGEPEKKSINTPLQLVFTGNIGANRWKSLAMIANALKELNKKEIKAQLRIYTATPLTNKMKNALSIEGSSYIMGSVPASEIPEIQRKADVLIHAEAFDLKNKLMVRQSFSTKIVDYLANAACILAVGPRDIASIDYFIKNDAGLVASNKNEVCSIISGIIKNPDIISDYGQKAYESGKKNHNRQTVSAMLQEDFASALSKK